MPPKNSKRVREDKVAPTAAADTAAATAPSAASAVSAKEAKFWKDAEGQRNTLISCGVIRARTAAEEAVDNATGKTSVIRRLGAEFVQSLIDYDRGDRQQGEPRDPILTRHNKELREASSAKKKSL